MSLLNAVIAAVIAILVALQLGLPSSAAIVVAVAAGFVVAALHFVAGRRNIARGRGLLDPLFPSPPD